jgi:hypothetical protein
METLTKTVWLLSEETGETGAKNLCKEDQRGKISDERDSY